MTSPVQTIFAEATAPGRAGVSIIRLSGPESRRTVEAFCGDLAEPRYLYYRRLARRGDLIDHALVVWFSGGASFTGEEMAEIHAHGGRAVVARILQELSGIGGLRAAEPGEFTRRALIAGRMDLSEVEGLADLIDSETEMQRRQAMALMNGAVSEMVRSWRSRVLHALALVEASIDFADEEDAPADVSAEWMSEVLALAAEFEHAAAMGRQGERIREGYRVALVGAPNAGKSTLLNALMNREIAITSPYEGTTRDIIEGAVDLGGLPVIFQDLAGLRDTDDPVEAIGVERAVQAARAADLRIFVLSRDTEDLPISLTKQTEDIVVTTKCDVFGDRTDGLEVSGVTGDGIDFLLRKVRGVLETRSRSSGLFFRVRQVDALCDANKAIVRALETGASEMMAFGLREAVHFLDDVIGKVDAEEVLGEVFSRFCIGK